MNRTRTYWSDVARALWPGLAGFALGAALPAWFGVSTLWAVAGGLAVAALIASFLAREGRLYLLEQRADLSGTAAGLLSPLAREVLAHLPDPLMLLDEGGRFLSVAIKRVGIFNAASHQGRFER